MPVLTVFVAGVHGVGKSSLCKYLAPRINAHHVTASSLIAKAKRLGSSKAVSEIEDNQRLLVEEHRKVSEQYSKILLDGHFCLISKSGRVEALSMGLFRELGIRKIVVARCAPQLIHDRMVARDGSAHRLSISDIDSFQQAELEHAEATADSLSLPLLFVDTSEQLSAVDAAVKFVATGSG